MSSQEDTDTSDLTPSEDESSLSDSSDRESGMVSDDEELPAKRATVAVMEEDLSEFASIFVLDKDSSSRKRSEQKLSYESVSLEPYDCFFSISNLLYLFSVRKKKPLKKRNHYPRPHPLLASTVATHRTQ